MRGAAVIAIALTGCALVRQDRHAVAAKAQRMDVAGILSMAQENQVHVESKLRERFLRYAGRVVDVGAFSIKADGGVERSCGRFGATDVCSKVPKRGRPYRAAYVVLEPADRSVEGLLVCEFGEFRFDEAGTYRRGDVVDVAGYFKNIQQDLQLGLVVSAYDCVIPAAPEHTSR